MRMPIKLHEFNETDFTGGCLAYLGKAENVAVTENIDRPHTLSFDYPVIDEKAEMITENRIVSVDGQAYRISNVKIERTGAKKLTATATRIFFSDAVDHHIPTIGNDTDSANSTIGVDPYAVLRKAIEGTSFTLIPDSELRGMGMTRIGAGGELIDFFPTDKINTYDVIKAVIEAYGQGELYVDNYRFAVVERIGKDNGVRLTTTNNLSKLSVERQRTELATRVYPYGKDDMTISSIGTVRDSNGNIIHKRGEPFIISPEAVSKYGYVDKYLDFPDYTDPEKLFANAKWMLMGEDNENRMDTPQLTITADVIDLAKLAEYGDFYKIALGDTVNVKENDTMHHKRIIGITYYPYSAQQPTVTIGSMSNTDPFFVVWQRGNLLNTIKKNSTGTSKKIKTKYFNGKLNSTQNPVQSKNERLLLDGDLLVIEDSGGKRRINLGNVDGEFVFEIYGSTGKKRTIYINEDGDITITGVFATGTEDEARTVIDKNGIQSYDSAGNRYGLWCNEPNSYGQRYADFSIYCEGQNIFQVYNSLDGISLRYKNNNFLSHGSSFTKGYGDWGFENGASGSFETADGKIITVLGGLITDIS